ncbi:adenylate cyclase type 10-like isoform X1 [Amphibalanus amphitrite]|uniref:adenylate cyclase type 10-like isoform X1 n=1 Tax=Amphibalanus amphitrite TaxID=1232801 RepID=UPI001C90F4AB|nr:adenylate cyclase type 10-like isoform X1 [Amphibalanus amphitrite]
MVQKKAPHNHSPLEAPSARSSASRLSSLENRKKGGLEGSLDATGDMLNQHISQQLFVGDIGPERKTSNLRRLRSVIPGGEAAAAKRAQQLATHTPDVLIADQDTQMPHRKDTNAITFFVDVSGFTALTEKYTLSGRGGTDKLTETLNSYIGALVECILRRDGDVLQFAGDAILAMWACNSEAEMPAKLEEATACAVHIQEHYGIRTTDVGVRLKVKVGIACGEVTMFFIGLRSCSQFVIVGSAVDDVNASENQCESGDVVVSPMAWAMMKASTCYDADPRGNTGFMKVRHAVRDDSDRDSKEAIDLASVRQSIAVPSSMEAKLTPYVIPPVLKKLADDQPLEYLSEMRQVSIVFCQLATDGVSSELPSILQDAFVVMHKKITAVSGCLNKVFAFDKGITFLVIFGLPGFKHKNEVAHALQCADAISQELLKEVTGINRVSIGVTTGPTFCGVIGHPARHEYTVIGRTVNKAARLMTNYPGVVSCDEDSYYHSHLPIQQFKKLEPKPLKGIPNPGNIYHFVPSDGELGQRLPQYKYPLLGRKEEIKDFTEKVKNIKETDVRIIVFEGESGIGKSRLLDALISLAKKNGCMVAQVTMTLQLSGIRGYALNGLFTQLLGLHQYRTAKEKEVHVMDHFKDKRLGEDLCLLNDLLQLKLPVSPKIAQSDGPTRKKMTTELLWCILKEHTEMSAGVVFGIDNAHFMDDTTWSFLETISSTSDAVLCVLSMMPPSPLHPLPDMATQTLKSKGLTHVRMKGLENEYLTALACQILEVKGVPHEVVKLLQEKSHGIPGWCEQLLGDMFQNQFLRVLPITSNASQDKHKRIVFANPTLVTKRSSVLRTVAASDSIHASSSETAAAAAAAVPDQSEKPRAQMMARRESRATKPSAASAEAESADGQKKDKYRKRASVFDKLLGRDKPLPDVVMPEIASVPEEEEEETPAEHPLVRASGSNMICDLAPGIVFANIPIPDTMRGMMMATFDKLKPFEQMFLKCGAILGNTFERQLLEAIIPNFQARKVRSAMRRLFELRIIMCATAPPNQEGHHNHPTAQVTSKSIECHCDVPPIIAALKSSEPQYVHCQLMRFVSAIMEELAYETLMEKQRQHLHRNAALQLEGRAHRCRSCGGGGFEHGGTTHSEAFKVSMRSSSMLPVPQNQEQSTRRSRLYQNTKVQPKGRERSQDISMMPGGSMQQSNQSFSKQRRRSRSSSMAPSESGDEEESSKLDRRACKCTEILATVYPQLIRHWKNANMVGKTVYFLSAAGEAAITLQDNSQALTYLREAQILVDEMKTGARPLPDPDDGDVIPVWWQDAKVENLMGQAYLRMGMLEDALSHLREALEMLEISFPTRVNIFHIWTAELTQFLHQLMPAHYLGSVDQEMAPIKVEAANCLKHLTDVFHLKHNESVCYLAALMQLNIAEAASTDFDELIMAYSSIIQACMARGRLRQASYYSSMAVAKLEALFNMMQEEDFATAASLYTIVLRMKLASGELYEALDNGYIALRINRRIHDGEAELASAQLLSQCLLLQLAVQELVDLSRRVMFIAEEGSHVLGKHWYYLGCLDTLIEAGFSIEDIGTCVSFVRDTYSDPSVRTEREAQFYAAATLALWYARTDSWVECDRWIAAAEEVKPVKARCVVTVHGLCKLLETRLIRLCETIVEQLYEETEKDEPVVRQYLKELDKAVEFHKVFKPRYLHMRAYFCMFTGKTDKAFRLLKEAVVMADRLTNVLDREWAKHSLYVWFEEVSEFVMTFWLRHSIQGELDWHDAKNIAQSKIMYTLPTPEYKSMLTGTS